MFATFQIKIALEKVQRLRIEVRWELTYYDHYLESRHGLKDSLRCVCVVLGARVKVEQLQIYWIERQSPHCSVCHTNTCQGTLKCSAYAYCSHPSGATDQWNLFRYIEADKITFDCFVEDPNGVVVARAVAIEESKTIERFQDTKIPHQGFEVQSIAEAGRMENMNVELARSILAKDRDQTPPKLMPSDLEVAWMALRDSTIVQAWL